MAEDVSNQYRGILVSPLLSEDGSFGAITLLSKKHTSYTTEHVRLLESVCQHASSALNNALTYEKTKDSALVDSLTELPNARAFYMMLEQRIAEGQSLRSSAWTSTTSNGLIMSMVTQLVIGCWQVSPA
jgi:GAF domain-containing protein